MSSPRRILTIWFPHLGAERLLRRNRGRILVPFAVVAETGNALNLSSICPLASAQGIRVGQPLSDARAFCPELLTAPQNPLAETAFLSRLRRWAGRFSPWVSEEPPAALMLDITGCAHLFGGEEAMAARIADDLAKLHLTAALGIADTPGAAWALARFSGAGASSHRSGDAIEQEARATRSRAFKRRNWERGGPAPARTDVSAGAPFIAPPSQTHAALARLPVAALRLDPETVTNLGRMGIRLVADLASLPRAAVARRFGQPVLARLDQAMGALPEPISPVTRGLHFATRLSLPDPIGLKSDIEAGIDRLLPPLCDKLEAAGRGARHLRLTCFRADHSWQVLEVGLARPSHDATRIRPLLCMQLDHIDAGFGIDVLRLEAHVTEPLSPHQHKGHAEAVTHARAVRDGGNDMADLLGRLGARIGLEHLIRLHPADSHIPEKTDTRMAAAFADPVMDWPTEGPDRPAWIFEAEVVQTMDPARPPKQFRWRRRDFEVVNASGPERLSPEWWLDDPAWRSGTRDYWRVDCATGERLWLFETRKPGRDGDWFCHGEFG